MNNKLSELKAAALAATPGPWELVYDDWNDGDDTLISSESRNGMVAIAKIEGGGEESGYDEPFSSEQQANAAFIAAANPAVILALLAELEREIEMRAQNLEIKTLLAEKVKSLETKLWDSQQLVDAKSGSQIELRSQISSLEERNRKDMAWRGERLCELEDSLEAAQKRIAELERANKSQDDHINQQQDRIDSLEKKNADLGSVLGAAEKRLAAPIKIVDYDEFFICHVSGASDDYCKGWVDGRNAAAREVGKAGFTVEGDEQ